MELTKETLMSDIICNTRYYMLKTVLNNMTLLEFYNMTIPLKCPKIHKLVSLYNKLFRVDGKISNWLIGTCPGKLYLTKDVYLKLDVRLV
jgi:hypothetical protein